MKRILLSALCLAAIGCGVESSAKEEQKADDGSVVQLGAVKSEAPGAWVKEKPSNNLRKYQFRIPKAEGDPKDAELSISPGGIGGSEKANMDRWIGFFDAPKGKSIDDVTKIEKLKIGKLNITYLDVSGTYKYKFPPFAPNAKITPFPNYRMFGVILQSADDRYFIKLIGPEKTLANNKTGFDRWLKSFK